MKTTIKLTLVIALFCSAAFADGDMTNGGKSCEGTCLINGQTVITKAADQKMVEDDLLISVKNFLTSFFR